MMNQQKSKKAGILKYSLIVPLALALVLSSNAETIVSKTKDIISKQAVVNNETADETKTAISAATEQVAPKLGAKTSTNDSIKHSQTKWAGPKLKARTLEHDKVYNSVDKMPEYPGGTDALMKFITQNLIYPIKAQENSAQGKVVIRFIINKHGKVEQAEIAQTNIKQSTSLKEIHVFGYGKKEKTETDKVAVDKADDKTNQFFNLLEKEALRVVNSLPAWTPGERKGKKAAVYYTLPITFRME